MSAIAKPFVNSTNANLTNAPVQIVNVEHVASIEKVDTTDGNNDSFEIHFVFANVDVSPRTVKWKYDDSAARDSDYDDILTLAATDVN